MAAEYQLRLYNAFQQQIQVVPQDAIQRLTYTLKLNTYGSLSITVDREALDESYLQADAQLMLWRRPEGTTTWLRDSDATWFVQKSTDGLDAGGSEYRRLDAVSAVHLLARRYVMYYAESAQAYKTNFADNMMKIIVRENLGTSADSSPIKVAGSPSRVIPNLLSVAADTSLGPSITKKFAWRNVLTVLQEIATDAAQAGTAVYFDLPYNGNVWEFTTYIRQRGVDRTSADNLFVASVERGNLGAPIEKIHDWSESSTWVIAGGQGQEAARLLGSAYDKVAIGASPFGLREYFVNATSASEQGTLNQEASGELRRRRATRTLTGTLLSTPAGIYGRDWNWGDRITAEHQGEKFTALVESVVVTLDSGKETITAAIKGETL